MLSYPPDFPWILFHTASQQGKMKSRGSIWVSCCKNAHKPTSEARIKETERAGAQSKDKLYKILHLILLKHILSVIIS